MSECHKNVDDYYGCHITVWIPRCASQEAFDGVEPLPEYRHGFNTCTNISILTIDSRINSWFFLQWLVFVFSLNLVVLVILEKKVGPIFIPKCKLLWLSWINQQQLPFLFLSQVNRRERRNPKTNAGPTFDFCVQLSLLRFLGLTEHQRPTSIGNANACWRPFPEIEKHTY